MNSFVGMSTLGFVTLYVNFSCASYMFITQEKDVLLASLSVVIKN